MGTRQSEPICREHVMAHAIAADLHTHTRTHKGSRGGGGRTRDMDTDTDTDSGSGTNYASFCRQSRTGDLDVELVSMRGLGQAQGEGQLV